MSTGWRFEKCILTLTNYSEIVMDSIVSFNLTSDMSMPDYKNTLIDEWMVFPKDTARFEYRYIGYTRDKGEVEWTKNQTQNVELWAKWGFYPDGSLYMDYAWSQFSWVSKIEILSEDSFIIRAARRPWFAHLDWITSSRLIA